MDGTNGSTTFVDNSPSPKTLTRQNGTFEQSTTAARFGPTGLRAEGVFSYGIIPPTDDFSFGAGDFTIEFWFQRIANAPFGKQIMYRATSFYSWQLSQVADTVVMLGYSTNQFLTLQTTSLPIGVWLHIAFVRSGTNGYCFVDGILVNSSSSLGSQSMLDTSPGNLIFGNNTNNPDFAPALFLDDLRITKGVARYTSNFTPPPAAFPDVDCSSTFNDPTINNFPVQPITANSIFSTDLIASPPVQPITANSIFSIDNIVTVPIGWGP